MTDEIDKLRDLCRSWGGDLIELTRDEFRTGVSKFEMAPFSSGDLAVLWSRKQIVYAEDVMWTEVIHEMGHTFACLKEPRDSREWDFFGWEHAVCLHLGLDVEEWARNNRDYVIDFHRDTDAPDELRAVKYTDFGNFDPEMRAKVIAEAKACSKREGLIAEDGRPIAIR